MEKIRGKVRLKSTVKDWCVLRESDLWSANLNCNIDLHKIFFVFAICLAIGPSAFQPPRIWRLVGKLCRTVHTYSRNTRILTRTAWWEDKTLIAKTTGFNEWHFLIRVLYRDCYWCLTFRLLLSTYIRVAFANLFFIFTKYCTHYGAYKLSRIPGQERNENTLFTFVFLYWLKMLKIRHVSGTPNAQRETHQEW